MATGQGDGWRRMAITDLAAVHAASALVHPDYPEDPAIFAERLQLYPQGCLVLVRGGGVQGYAVSHPWRLGDPPALDTLLGALPRGADSFHLHDLALLPAARGGGVGAQAVALLVAQARSAGFATLSLVAVGPSLPFWRRQGFEIAAPVGLAPGLATYGAHAIPMIRMLPPAPVTRDGAAATRRDCG